jgi:large subunit ribosomal protein L6
VSRIGKNPVPVPEGVDVVVDGSTVRVKGPKGEIAQILPANIAVTVEGGEVRVERPSDQPRDKAMHGLSRTLVANMVEGVTNGFMKKLEIIGVGYRAEAAGRTLRLALGYSHPILYPVPEGIEVATPTPTTVEIRGADKQMVGQVAAEIRGFRKAEPYKGKGIRYEGEYVRRKAGKTGV